RPEDPFHFIHYISLHLFIVFFFVLHGIESETFCIHDGLCARIGGHNDHRVSEVYFSSLRICDMSVIQHLKQDIEYIRMRFLDLIKEYHRIWMPSDFFAELSAVLMSYISRRGADQLGYAVFFHVFG